MGIAGVEAAERFDEELHVVVLTGHQMTAAEIDPLELREPAREFFFDMNERAREVLCRAFAMAMNMKAFECRRELGRKILSEDAETGAWGTGVVELCLYLTIFGIDAKT
jgi:hypothetical protein